MIIIILVQNLKYFFKYFFKSAEPLYGEDLDSPINEVSYIYLTW